MTRAAFIFKYKKKALESIAEAEQLCAIKYNRAGDCKNGILFAKQSAETWKALNDYCLYKS